MSSVKIKIIIGSTRQNRFSEHPARWIKEEAGKIAGAEIELLDLRDYPLPFFDEPVSPAMVKGDYANEAVRKWAQKIAEADAYIIMTPEYNHGYSAVLKNALDSIYKEWNNKPVGFISWGGAAGARSVEQLRQVVIELQMAPIRNAVHISSFWTLFDESGQLKSGAFDSLKDNAENFLGQLMWWAKALKKARENKQL
ncbi:MAG: NAD(P)H-dependent oxidoreductase [Patescibacteria group bacterium]